MKRLIELKGVEKKKAKNGRLYSVYDTNEGVMSCFESKVCELLNQHIGKRVEAEIETTGAFTNIRAFYKPLEEEKTIITEETIGEEPKETRYTPMYVSYAKDIFVSLKNGAAIEAKETDDVKLMLEAIELIKLARGAFK